MIDGGILFFFFIVFLSLLLFSSFTGEIKRVTNTRDAYSATINRGEVTQYPIVS